ncbi:putative amidase [Lachnellula suecica]|uniref:amidase n=1 Tax=Lachnellula suecica TaxID=602035 RepID=A0A8T9C6Y3_9HELO|nr:putative amidase [Lachnellula suecica]
MIRETWESKAQIARDILAKSIKTEWLVPVDKLPGNHQLNVIFMAREAGILTEQELKITETDATGLVESMAAGEVKAEEVLIAFAKRATIGHQLLNFATEFMIDEALEEAKKLDAYFHKTGNIVGPLHGVPISVKEMVHFKDRRCHTAYVAWIDRVSPEDALLIRNLKKAGALFHVRTNEPQTVMHLDCNNNIYGRTLNPYNLNLTPGGSSGGEGASLGFRCAAIGVGSDIGGSVRAPAAFCGAYGLRPTMLRNPWKGVSLAGEGQESIRCTLGPLTNSLRDIDLFQKSVLDQEPWEEETSLVPIPWRTTERKDFVVGIMWNDGVAQTHPPMRRILDYGVNKLKEAGVKVVDWEPFEHARGGKITQALLFPDGGKSIRKALEASGEPIMPLSKFALNYAKEMNIAENWELNVERDKFRDQYHILMKERGVDFILCPTFVGAAPEHGTAHYWLYTSIWNLLDLPAVVFPSGFGVDPEINAVDGNFRPMNDIDKAEQMKYVPGKFRDAPLAYQLIGKHFRDEETVAAAQIVERIIRG